MRRLDLLAVVRVEQVLLVRRRAHVAQFLDAQAGRPIICDDKVPPRDRPLALAPRERDRALGLVVQPRAARIPPRTQVRTVARLARVPDAGRPLEQRVVPEGGRAVERRREGDVVCVDSWARGPAKGSREWRDGVR